MESSVMDDIKRYALSYLHFMGEEDVTEEIVDGVIDMLESAYVGKRNYPETYTSDMIESDINGYFGIKKAAIGMRIIPEVIGRFGAEGHSSLEDNQITREWIAENYFDDKNPIARVI